MTAFGLDPSGYSQSNSGFTRADLGGDGIIEVTVYERHVFSQTLRGPDPLEKVAEAEKKVLRACCGVGSVVVDVPIDLQGLPCPEDAYFTWELVKRPVDYAFDPSLAPLANYIGAPVARFRNLLSALREEDSGEAINNVLETYPAATLKLLELWAPKYGKHPVHFAKGRWGGGPMADIANSLRMVAGNGEMLTGDEFDAAICAVTGVVNQDKRLAGNKLSDEVFRRIQEKVSAQDRPQISTAVPDNYVLMRDPPGAQIRIVRKSVDGLEEMLEEVTT
jgi:hypothetical protein